VVSPGRGGGQDVSPEVRATRQVEFAGGEMPPKMATRRAKMENMSDEERETFRTTTQAGGGFPSGAGGTVQRPAESTDRTADPASVRVI